MSIFNDPWQPSGRSTWPDSVSDVEHGFMKVPGKRKMIKIRQTIYEDPGNPFQDELDAERGLGREDAADLNKPLPDAPDDESPTGRSFFELDLNSEVGSEAGLRLSLDRSLHSEPSEISPTARSFRFDSADDGSHYTLEAEHMPRAVREPQDSVLESPKAQTLPQHVRREHHRSMSLAIPVASPLGGEEYVSPRRFWRRENSLPLMKEAPEQKKEVTVPRSARDTKFYGFYEDLMKDYNKRRIEVALVVMAESCPRISVEKDGTAGGDPRNSPTTSASLAPIKIISAFIHTVNAAFLARLPFRLWTMCHARRLKMHNGLEIEHHVKVWNHRHFS